MTTMKDRIEAAAKAVDAGFGKAADAAYEAAQIAKAGISEKPGSDTDYKYAMAFVDLFDHANGLFSSAVAVADMADRAERMEVMLKDMARMFRERRDSIMGVAK